MRLSASEIGGSVVLRRLNTPLIICDLQDISELGCRCIARVRINDWTDNERWRTLLNAGELYEAEITFDPYVPFIRLPVEIKNSTMVPGSGFELGLSFFELEPDHKAMLNKAMISVATEKIKQSRGVLKNDTQPGKTAEESLPISSPHYPSPSISLPQTSDQESAMPSTIESIQNPSQSNPIAPAVYSGEQSAYAPPPPAMRVSPPPPEYAQGAPSEQFPEAPAQRMGPNTRARLSAFRRPTDFIPPPEPQPSQDPNDEMIRVPTPVPDSELPQPPRKLGEVLSNASKLTRPEIHNAIASARLTGQRLGEYLVNEGILSPIEIVQARSAQTGIPWVDLDSSHVKLDLLDLFPFSKMKKLQFVPFEGEPELIRIATANPISKVDMAELTRIVGRHLEQYLCREDLPRQFLESVARRVDNQRRVHPRFKVSLPMSFQCYPNESGVALSGATFRGRTLDISQGGMQVTGPSILGVEPGALNSSQLRLMVTVGAVPNDIVGLCETRHVRRVHGSGGGASCVYGLRLESMSQEHRDILQGMIDRVTRSQSGLFSDVSSGSGESYS